MKQNHLAADRHDLWYFLFWPLYLMRYFLIENLTPWRDYTVIHCSLDDRIPFQEGFLIFYVFWYVFIVGMHLYTALYDREAFRRYSKSLLISMSISTAVFLIFPSCQQLRPTDFPRDNLLTALVGVLYRVDTNTNVFPSEHVIGAVAVWMAAVNCRSLRSPGKLTAISVLAVLICLSTVFLKQHSVLDGLAALPVCAISWYFSYGIHKKRSALI